MANRAAWMCLLILVASSSACGGSGDDGSSNDTNQTDRTASSPSVPGAKADFTATPVQLTVDPCTLVTKSEAEALVGAVGDTNGSTYTPPKCIYVSNQNTGGQLVVALTEPDFCKFLFLALDKNMFGGVQVRQDDVGDGGMLVKGNGNVQFVVKGGCVEIAATVTNEQKVDDSAMLSLAKVAAGRVS